MAGARDMRILRFGAASCADLAAISRTALDRPLTHSAELIVAVPSDEGVVLGSLQRLSELDGIAGASSVGPSSLVVRRGTGGAECHVGPGTVWMQLALSSPSALVACEPDRLCNRYVRPLLRALTKVGALAHYFDRDWVSASKAPVASVSFAHDTQTGRSLVEAFVAVDTPFALRDRPSFMGKTPRTLRALGLSCEAPRVGVAVVDAYRAAYGSDELAAFDASSILGALAGLALRAPADDPREDPPWAAVRAEAIGIVAAGRDRAGRMRVGGELMASRDALTRLEEAIASSAGDPARLDPARLDQAVDALAAPGVALLGVRDLRSIRAVIAEALGQ